MRKHVVIDTNVLVVANGGESYSPTCILKCVRRLHSIQKAGCVVLDYGHEILTEYAKNQVAVGQPGVGYLFWKWLLNTKATSGHCEWVSITKREPSGYEEFPEHEELCEFDPADQKFVAVAVAHSARPPILQASDSKWWGWKDALSTCGVTVEFLCAEEIESKFREKMGDG